MRRSIVPLLAIALASSLVACAEEESPSSSEPAVASEDDELNQQAPGKPATAPQLPESYASSSAIEKQAALWKMISSDDYCGQSVTDEVDYAKVDGCFDAMPSGGTGYGFKALKSMLSLKKTFNHESDELPEGRKKLFHPFGAVATADFTTIAGPYTGMLAKGQTLPVVIRLSPGGGGKLIPGIAVKFFVDGRPSVNLQAIQDFDGQDGDDNNYFHSTPSNIVPPAKSLAIRLASQIFKTVKRDPNHLQIDHVCETDTLGPVADGVIAPYQIKYEPHGDVATRFAPVRGQDFRAQLRRIPPGTVIYDVTARVSESSTTFEKIGEIKTTSWLVATGRGDYQLFFQHHRGTN